VDRGGVCEAGTLSWSNVAVIGKGTSTTSSITTSTVIHAHTPEIQYLLSPADPPCWLTRPSARIGRNRRTGD
jgi:hypothetical protein